jgi:hypothetical protein
VRLRLPLGRKGLLAASAAAAAIVYWRVRAARREEEEREWDEAVSGAVDEGMAAGRAATDAEEH